MSELTRSARVLAQWLVGFMSLGPFGVALDLATHIFPPTPVIQLMRSAGTGVHLAWIGCGFICIAIIILLARRPFWGFLLSLVLATVYIPLGIILWHKMTLHSWAALIAPLIAACAAFGSRFNRSADG